MVRISCRFIPFLLASSMFAQDLPSWWWPGVRLGMTESDLRDKLGAGQVGDADSSADVQPTDYSYVRLVHQGAVVGGTRSGNIYYFRTNLAFDKESNRLQRIVLLLDPEQSNQRRRWRGGVSGIVDDLSELLILHYGPPAYQQGVCSPFENTTGREAGSCERSWNFHNSIVVTEHFYLNGTPNMIWISYRPYSQEL